MYSEQCYKLGSNRSAIRELFEYGKQRAAVIGKENVYDFSLGNPTVPAPDCVKESIMELLNTASSIDIHGYTSAQGDVNLRSALAEYYNTKYGTGFHADNFYITCGAAASLCITFRALTESKADEFIAIAPFFPEYKAFVEGNGAAFRMVKPDTEHFQINMKELAAAINEHTKGIIINSPNNPSGAVYSEETIKKLAAILEDASARYHQPIYLITDEPYREIVFGGETVPFMTKYYKNTLVCYSWSKSLSLPGERLGYVIVPYEAEDSQLVYAAVAGAGRSLGYVCAPGLFQRVCAECANETADISVYETNKTLLTKSLRDMGYHVVEPKGTFYMFPRTLIDDDIAFCEKAKDYILLIVPGTGFGCSGHTRISYCVPTSRIEKSLDAFEKLAKYYK